MMLRLSIAVLLFAVLAQAQTDKYAHAPVNTQLTIQKPFGVAGLSAGAFFTVQLQVAYNQDFAGAGVIAGGPFYCAEGQLTTAVTACMNSPLLINVGNLVNAYKVCYDTGACDNSTALAKHKVWMFSGTQDTVVKQGVMDALVGFYEAFIPKESLSVNFDVPAEHSWVTNDYGNTCGHLGSPFINNCEIDASAKIVQQIFGLTAPAVTPNNANIQSLSQASFTPDGVAPSSISLGETAYVYVPTKCQQGASCRLLIVNHGCEQTIADIGLEFVEHIQMNGIAEANNLVVLYPQAIRSYVFPSNPNGCFDWWGYSGADYSSKAGPQMVTVMNMAHHLAGSS